MAAISTNPVLRVSHAPSSTHDEEDRRPAKPADEPGLSSESDGDGDGDDSSGLFNDPDEVQSLFQPSLSPAATRLASPSTPAAERAAALDKLPDGGLFSVMEDARAEASTTPTPPGEEDAGAVSPRQAAKPQRLAPFRFHRTCHFVRRYSSGRQKGWQRFGCSIQGTWQDSRRYR